MGIRFFANTINPYYLKILQRCLEMSKNLNFQLKIAQRTRRLVVIILQKLPISSEIIGSPKGFYSSTYDCIAKSNKLIKANNQASYKQIYAGGKCLQAKPITLGDNIHWKFRKFYEHDHPKTFVAVIPSGRVWGFSGSVITPDDRLLADVSVEFVEQIKYHSIFNQIKLAPIHKIKGTVAVLSATGGYAYYHFMFDVLPRIHLLHKAEIAFDNIDYFLVNSYQSPFHREMLGKLGISETKILESSKYPHIKADKLIVPSLPGVMVYPPAWAGQFLREEFLNCQITKLHGGERIYISRAKASRRKVTNENELVNFLSQLGFKTIILESLPVSEQALIFASAKIVVAPHGAGLSNVIFCPRGNKIIEIFSPQYINIMYWCLSNQMGLEYYYIFGKGQVLPDYVESVAFEEDIIVDLEALSSILKIAGILTA
jgi:capsular polysaccharide biosynthesis protein